MYQVEINNKGGYSFQVKSKDYAFTVGLKGDGMLPPDVLLASLGSCIGVYTRKYLEGAKLEVGEFNIKVEADFSKEPPVCFRKISVSLDLKGNKFDERRQQALLEFIQNCPVQNTLKGNPEIEIKLGWREV